MVPLFSINALFKELGIKMDEEKRFVYNDKQYSVNFDTGGGILREQEKEVEKEWKFERKQLSVENKDWLNVSDVWVKRRPISETKSTSMITDSKGTDLVPDTLNKSKGRYLLKLAI